MSPIYSFVLCVLFAMIAVAQGERLRRASSSSSSHSSSESSSGSSSGGGGLRFPSDTLYAAQRYAAQNPSYAPVYQRQFTQLQQQQQAMLQNYFPSPNVAYNQVTPPKFNSYNGNPVYTAADVSYGPQGGYGQASAYPGGADGLGVRIAEEFDAPSGGSFGVFSSSSSGTSDIDGKKTSFRTSTFGTDNNGRITFRTINE